MRHYLCSLLLLISLAAAGAEAASKAVPAAPNSATLAPEAPYWKGRPYDHNFHISGLAGIGLIGGSVGFGVNAAIAFKILHEGFLDDINDQAYIELMGEPLFVSGTAAAFYSATLRWDFHKTDLWTFYALGGLAGNIAGVTLGNLTTIHPRFGIGAMWNLFEFLSFRGEVSHEFTSIGISYLL